MIVSIPIKNNQILSARASNKKIIKITLSTMKSHLSLNLKKLDCEKFLGITSQGSSIPIFFTRVYMSYYTIRGVFLTPY